MCFDQIKAINTTYNTDIMIVIKNASTMQILKVLFILSNATQVFVNNIRICSFQVEMVSIRLC